jgi:hypothetical protein
MNEFKKQNYSEQVVEYVKGLILSGKLAPGKVSISQYTRDLPSKKKLFFVHKANYK